LAVHTSPAIRRASPPPFPVEFFLRAAFLAATGVLLIVWLAAA
jgi:hypothetical protein